MNQELYDEIGNKIIHFIQHNLRGYSEQDIVDNLIDIAVISTMSAPMSAEHQKQYLQARLNVAIKNYFDKDKE